MPIAQRRTARFERIPCALNLVVYFSPACGGAAEGREDFFWSMFAKKRYTYGCLHACAGCESTGRSYGRVRSG